ncbi:MAG TPA: AAA family ATPase [Nocardioidaceae bacterium]|nr:AAA family ATPase [Nocardioidaceae bacterium]
MIDVRLLGPPRVEVDGAPVAFDTRKAVALLAYLALSDLPRPRDLLADLLWGDGDTHHARGALRRTLSTIRSSVHADCLETDRSTVALRSGPAVLVDVRRARQAVADQDFELAASLHAGEFLEGLALTGAPAFEEWQQVTAEALRAERGSLLRRLASSREDGGDLPGALDAARQWLALDDLHEPAHQTVIRLTARAGDRAGALARYRDCVRILDRELGVAPLAETTALYEAAQNATLRVPPSPPPVQPGAAAPTPLVGRDSVLAALLDAHRGVARQGRVVVIEGEAGIGKTRLAEELLTRVEGDGTETLVGRAFEEESSLSYAPVVQALRSRLRDPHWAGGLSDNARRAAGRLLPELLVGQRATPFDATSPGAEERFLAGLWEALVAPVSVPAGTPADPGTVVFLLDDAQWADEATLALVAYGSRRLAGRRLLVVLTWRTPSERPLRRVLAELERSGAAAVHTLHRLEHDHVAAVVRAVRPDHSEQQLVGRLFAETEGLPFLLVEYLRALDASAEQWSIPEGARDLLRARLGRLSEVGRQLLAAAAVIGRSFDVDAVRVTSGRAEEEVVAGLEELTSHGFVREASQDYDFSHETLRSLVHADISLARRRLLHRRAAQVSTDAASEARHLQLAGESDAAAAAYVRAATQAQNVFATTEALSHLRTALALGHPDPAALEVEAADLLTRLGDYPAAVAGLERAAATADPRLLWAIEHRLGQVHQRSGSWALAEAHLAAALAVTPSRDDGARARITADLSLALLSGGDVGRASHLAVESLAAAEAAADTRALAQANNLLGLLASRAGDADEALRHLEASLTLAKGAGDRAAQVAALNNLALAHRDRGDLAGAVERLQRALVLCAHEGDRHREAAVHNNLADLLHASGDAEQAMHHLKLAVAIFAEVGAVAGEPAEIWKLVQW